jgi:2-polyprenyl-6-methoxyphenol hydroxylase-like FAD-dependent oxidoreductase
MKQADADHDVLVLERRSPGYAGGWGVTVWEDLLDDLRAADEISGSRIAEACFKWRYLVLDVNDERVEYEGGCYAVSRAVVLDILTARAIELGVEVRFDTDVTAADEFAGADVVVAADGVRSVLRDRSRERFGTNIVPGKAKFVWLGSTKVFDEFTFAFVHTDAGWVWFYAYAFDDLTSTFIPECTEATWRGLGLHEASACESLRILEQIFSHQLKGESLMSNPGREDATLQWMTFPTVTNERWYDGNVVLMGDAAHTTHFSIGFGMRLAMQDAIALASELRQQPTVDAAFAAYDAGRRDAIVGPQTEARFSQQWFEDFARYADLPPTKVCALLQARRDPLMPKLPPRLYYRIDRVMHSAGWLRTLRHRVGPVVRTLYGKRAHRRAARNAKQAA